MVVLRSVHLCRSAELRTVQQYLPVSNHCLAAWFAVVFYYDCVLACL